MTLSSVVIQFHHINEYIERINNADDFNELLVIFQSQIEQLGFNKFTYWMMWPPFGPRRPLYISSFREDYSEHYVNNDFKNIDAVWHQTSKQTTPFSWSEVVNSTLMQQETHKIVFDQARDFQMLSGATIPLYGPGKTRAAVSVACDIEQNDFDKQYNRYRPYLQIISTYLHERIIQIFSNSYKTSNHNLTPREREVLLWTAKGKTSWDISQILMISENTVHNHIRNICEKYEVRSEEHNV